MYQSGYQFYPYNSYGSYYPNIATRRQGIMGGLSRLLGRNTNNTGLIPKAKFNWSGLLTNTQKTLGVINQAIPIFYQVRPMWNNAKTMFKIAGALNSNDKTPVTNQTTPKEANDLREDNDISNRPQFFI